MDRYRLPEERLTTKPETLGCRLELPPYDATPPAALPRSGSDSVSAVQRRGTLSTDREKSR